MPIQLVIRILLITPRLWWEWWLLQNKEKSCNAFSPLHLKWDIAKYGPAYFVQLLWYVNYRRTDQRSLIFYFKTTKFLFSSVQSNIILKQNSVRHHWFDCNTPHNIQQDSNIQHSAENPLQPCVIPFNSYPILTSELQDKNLLSLNRNTFLKDNYLLYTCNVKWNGDGYILNSHWQGCNSH